MFPTFRRPDARTRGRWIFFGIVLAWGGAVIGCAVLGRLTPNLHSEYFNIAQALAAGEGFAHPFSDPTGPTAWMPPILPAFLAGLLWISNGDRAVVLAVMTSLHVAAVIVTGTMIMVLARHTTRRAGVLVTSAALLVALFHEYRVSFHAVPLDAAPVLLAVDVMIIALIRFEPMGSWHAAAAWGLMGGLGALLSPIVGFTWGMLTLAKLFWHPSTSSSHEHPRRWSGLGVSLLIAGLTVSPWLIRNYLLFGRLIPVKSNLAYELYQSQCLQSGGLLQVTTFASHPYRKDRPEGLAYRELGETAYLDRKRAEFWEAVAQNPNNFIRRLADRFLGAVFWYEPFHRTPASNTAWRLGLHRVIHPLPFVALLILLFTAIRVPLHGAQWVIMEIYLFFLLPYVVVSYYDRYAFPLIGAKVLLVVWAADRMWSWRPNSRMILWIRSLRPGKP